MLVRPKQSTSRRLIGVAADAQEQSRDNKSPSENATPAAPPAGKTFGADLAHTDSLTPQSRNEFSRAPNDSSDTGHGDNTATTSNKLVPRASAALAHSAASQTMQPSSEFADDLSEHPDDYYGLAYLDFQDSRYVVKKECVIIGRPPESHLTLAEVTDPAVHAGDSPIYSKKRKRSDVDQDDDGGSDADSHGPRPVFQGGLGGPQEHGPSYLDEDAEFIYIWPPADDAKGQPPNLKAISKRHLRFLFDGQDHWQLDVLGRNGVVINRDFFPQGSHVTLEDGDSFWVADVHFSFNIPELEAGEGEYSDDDEDVNAGLYDSAEINSNEASSEIGSGEEERDDDEEDGEDSAVSVQRPPKTGKRVPKPKPGQTPKGKPKKTKIRINLDQNLSDSDQEIPSIENGTSREKARRPNKVAKSKPHKGDKKSPRASEEAGDDDEQAPKKRGPGRPPKDGVMSKRARRALQKAAELDRDDGDVAAGKVKGRPRKVSEANDQGLNGETKKPKKSKRAQTDGADGKDGEGKPIGETANEEPAPPPPPREPSPKESDFQEHELQKPDKPYSVCLYNVLRESERSLALPEIYEAFKKRWPYFRFRTGGDGWQSSIRHNLQSTKCLVKDGKAGKGHLWTVDPNIPLDNRASSRNELASLPQPYYGQAGQASSMMSAQNQHLPMRAPPNSGFPGQQNIHQYQMSYMNSTANGQRPPSGVPNTGVQQYQASPMANTGQFGSQNQGQFNAHRPGVHGAGPSGTQPQHGVPPQRNGPGQALPQSQPSQLNHTVPNALNPTTGQKAQANEGQPGTVQSSSAVQASGVNGTATFTAEKLLVFDQFRNRLLGMAQNETQKKYYVDILNQGQAWCEQHHGLGVRYDGTRTDIAQIVQAFQDAWEGHLKKKLALGDRAQGPSSSSSPAPTSIQTKTSADQNSNLNGASGPKTGDLKSQPTSAGNVPQASSVSADSNVDRKASAVESQTTSGDTLPKVSAAAPASNPSSSQPALETKIVQDPGTAKPTMNDTVPKDETAKAADLPKPAPKVEDAAPPTQRETRSGALAK